MESWQRMDEKYILIVEFKQDNALVMEQYIENASLDNIYERQKVFLKRHDVVGVCIARLEYESGKKALMK